MRPEEYAALVEQSIRAALAPLVQRLAIVEGKATATEIKLAAFDAWRPIPGPPGPAGAPGKDGADGKDGAPGLNGKDGAAGLRYCGVFQPSKGYEPGDVVTHAGCAWHANDVTGLAVPGEGSRVWQLMVKRGRDAKEGKGP